MLPVRVTALVLVFAAALAGAGTSSRAQPASCRDGGDRMTKLTMIEQLRRNPELLILGSSRARPAEPSFIERLTGHAGFNAAVTSGSAADAWVMTRYAAERFPRGVRRYIWFVDVGIATNGVHPDLAADPRAQKYLAGAGRSGASGCRVSSRYRSDGSLAAAPALSPEQRARTVATSVARLVAAIRAHPPKAGPVDQRRYVYFERAVEFMNQQGSRPVIVLNPIHPTVLAELEKHGFPARRTALEYLERLGRELDLVVVDCQDIRAWHGSAAHFSEATHVDPVNMRRMLRYVVARSGGALG